MDRHNIHPIESPGAVRALAHPVGDPVLDTLLAEDVPACLEDCVLEVGLANGT
jgi:hypothetical protein